jgi:hypothetical protein
MKKNLIAIAVLVLLGIATAVLFLRPDGKSGPADPSKAPIAALDKDGIDSIRIERTEGSGDKAVQENILLSKTNGAWRMAEPVDYAVEIPPIERMVELLSDIKYVDVISQNPAKHAELEVSEDKGVKVTVSGGGKELLSLLIGKTASGMSYVRLPGSDEVHRVTGFLRGAFHRSAKTLREKKITNVDAESLAKVEVSHAGQQLVLESKQDGETKTVSPVGAVIQNFNEDSAKSLMRTLATLSAREFVDEQRPIEETGLDDSATKLIMTAKAGDEEKVLTLLVGKDTEDGSQTYVQLVGQPQVFTLSKSSADKLRVTPDSFARTDEEMAKEEERRKKAAESAANMPPGGMPGMGGMPGGGQIPPELMKQIQAQMAAQGGGAQ